ncbi:hypothetical protein BH09PAT3_BH09PAT3_2560 [soil metagenome]
MATKKTTDLAPEVEEVIVEAQATEVVEAKTEATTTKAGKRSAKAVAEAEAKVEKEERKAARAETEAEDAEKPKAPVTPTRSRLERRGKQFRKVAENIEVGKAYSLDEAVALAIKTSTTKFDATVELHVRLGVDPRHADQNIRDNLVLPAGTGKTVKVAVLADVDDAAAALKAGADVAGLDEILKDLEKGNINFDTLIATPSQMAKLGKHARVLGPRGLMPNPKSGTVTTDVAKAVKEAKAGRVEYRVDSTGIVHMGVGKVSFTPAQLSENLSAVFASIRGNKPASIKGTYFKAVHLSTTMGPSIVIDLAATN